MPSVITTNALARLNELSAKSISIQAAVAYWCLPGDELDPGFLRGISHAEGFLCCDLHSPTSINCLNDLNLEGANVYLLLYQLVGRTEAPDSKGIPDHLMHSKVLVFNFSGDECVIWVGSHNATRRALLGINYECALVEATTRGSPLHSAVMSHLHSIREKSTKFSSQDVDYYRALQSGLNLDGFIEVEDGTGVPLQVGSEITVFSTNPSDHQQLKSVGSKLYLSVTDGSGRETIYSIRVGQTGEFTKTNRHDLSFGARRYAFKSGSAIPILRPREAVPRTVYDKAAFFAVLKIEASLADCVALEAPPEKLWQDVASESLRPEVPDLAKRRPVFKIQRAARSIVAEAQDVEESIWTQAFQMLPLEDRRSLQSTSLFRRRILRRPEEERLDPEK